MSEIKKVVVLDAGHFSFFNIGISKLYYESVAMLKLCRLMRDELNATGKIECLLTRDNEYDISLYNRGRIASEMGAFIFISEHTNATDDPTIKGVEVFYSVDIRSDKIWADKLSFKVAQVMGTSNRGSKTRESKLYPGEDYLGVIDSAQDNGVQHVFLIENGFHSNFSDESVLRSDEGLDKIAIAQCEVICEMCGFEYNSTIEEERNGFIMFNETYYLKTYSDIASAVNEGVFPTGKAHYDAYGKAEGRKAYPQLPSDFNEGAYLKGSPDVAKVVANGDYVCGASHWVEFGWNEPRNYTAEVPIVINNKPQIDEKLNQVNLLLTEIKLLNI